MLVSWKQSYDKPREHIQQQRHHFAIKGSYSESYGFSNGHISHVRMWELDHKEGWTLKNWCFWIVVLEKTLESFLDCKEIKPVNHKENQAWIFTGRTDSEDELPILWPPDVKSRFIEKTLIWGTIEGRRRRGWQRMKWLNGITNSRDLRLRKFWKIWRTGEPGVVQSMVSQGVRHDLVTKEQLEWKKTFYHYM